MEAAVRAKSRHCPEVDCSARHLKSGELVRRHKKNGRQRSERGGAKWARVAQNDDEDNVDSYLRSRKGTAFAGARGAPLGSLGVLVSEGGEACVVVRAGRQSSCVAKS